MGALTRATPSVYLVILSCAIQATARPRRALAATASDHGAGRWFEARSSAIQRACHHKFGRSSPFSGSLSRWTFCNGNRIQLPRYRFSTGPQALQTLPVWLGQRQTSKTAPGAQINGHTIHLPPILAKKPDVCA